MLAFFFIFLHIQNAGFFPNHDYFFQFFYAFLFIFRATDTKKSQNHSGLDSEILDDSDNI